MASSFLSSMLSRSDVQEFACPKCGADPGDPCVGARNKVRESCHRERWQVAQRDAASSDVERMTFTVDDDGFLVSPDGAIVGRIAGMTLELDLGVVKQGTSKEGVVSSGEATATTTEDQLPLEMGGSKPPEHRSDEVDDVWQHYVATMQPRNVTLNPQERKLIRDALKVATTDELKLAITGCRRSAFHMGQNDRNRKYNRLSQIIKGRVGKETTRERIDYFIDIAVKAGYSLTGVAGSASEGWVDVDALPSVHRATITDLRRRVVLAHRSGDTAAEVVARDELRAEGFEVVFEGDRYVGVKRVQS